MAEYIEREAAMRFNFSITAPLDKKIQVRDAVLNTMMKIVSYIEAIPAADVAPVKHGEWVDGKRMCLDGTFYWFRECSLCGYEREDDNEEKDTNYCPNCGARMGDEDVQV